MLSEQVLLGLAAASAASASPNQLFKRGSGFKTGATIPLSAYDTTKGVDCSTNPEIAPNSHGISVDSRGYFNGSGDEEQVAPGECKILYQQQNEDGSQVKDGARVSICSPNIAAQGGSVEAQAIVSALDAFTARCKGEFTGGVSMVTEGDPPEGAYVLFDRVDMGG